MAEGVEAAGEIEAVGDTGEVKAFDGKNRQERRKAPRVCPGSEAQYVLHACIHLLMVYRL